MTEPIRRTQTPQTTPDELARLRREQQRMKDATDAEEALRVLLIDVSRQIAQCRRRYMAALHPRAESYEVVRITLRLASGDTIAYRVHPGWQPDRPAEQQQTEEKGQEPSNGSTAKEVGRQE